ncbi:MAG TPA: transcription-repair coupling factor [Bacteroidales bacterium]|jgi:transcription-repair coupling factor (superfamily II helicase)|nr:transcription-repair coupling factor [Bacteroidales bacterium]HOL98835.1 transcription-repair coupling factor [Bacteroidales bacterium]HRT00435.1 transcription-repair coupling factor [Bacteroidales bacterium]HUM33242.1 transcription-repair coupling factor [Bacteroidales bacterium]
MKQLTEKIFSGNPAFIEVENYYRNSDFVYVNIQGLSGSSSAFLVSELYNKNRKLTCIICNDKEQASYFYDDIVNILGQDQVLFYPSSYKRSVEYLRTDKSNIVLKTEVLNKLLYKKKPYIIVTYPGAIIEKVVTNKTLKTNTLEIGEGESLSMDFVIEVLNEYGFNRADFVYEPGTFAVRGSIIDVFSYGNEKPYRIDFFGDEIESIRIFDPETQLSEKKEKRIRIVPDLSGKNHEDQLISFLEYVGENCRIFLENSQLIKDRIQKVYSTALQRFEENQNFDFDEDLMLLDPKKNLIDADSFLKNLNNYPVFEFDNPVVLKDAKTVKFNFNPHPVFNKQFELFINFLKEFRENNYEIYLLCNNQKQLERLVSILQDLGENNNMFIPIINAVNKGFIDNYNRVVVLTDHQIFERYHRYKTKTISRGDALTINDLSELKPGDYVVHVDNGIGKFGGLQKIEVNGKIQEAVSIIYDCNDILYVNIHSLHRISKYRDKDGEPPKIYRLGSGYWQKLKSRTKKNIKDIARDLILLYAKRLEQKGFAFSPDSYLQYELESSFMYEDTPDQIKTMESIKKDMESDVPMDRLVCGDVGFGKTELAIRAAFKAVTDGKQVAVLVPTTILALQHYQTFSERLNKFPVTVAQISRLKSASENKNTLQLLKEGKIDIIIGTHRLVSKDVEFKDLGLLIIDEEQKFGVAVKEKLKRIKINVDTLTLTATPIPRTLQFSLMGARDLSVINTPPPNRQPIITELHAFNTEIIKEAIYYEISRNGQVFFVNNRIDNIYEIQRLIAKLCPEVKTVVAHGQMEGEKLEKIILEFMRGDYDVLISTAIIENGVDIPNVNTIIINNANNFGLSDLHQLRGRVGRSNRKAFCYLLAPPLSSLTPDARRRLKAIEEFSDLGSGLNIALQDLDIRGAGNILGSEQSGFITEIGYETYTKILNEAIEELKEEEFRELFSSGKEAQQSYIPNFDCQIETDLNARIPDYYVSVTSERIKLYKQIDELKNQKELEEFISKITDRFGEPPEETLQLFDIVKIKWLAQKIGFEKLVLKNETFIGYFPLDQQSVYYSSKIFAAIIMYVQKFPKNFIFKEINSKLTLRLNYINNIKALHDKLQKIVDFMDDYVLKTENVN